MRSIPYRGRGETEEEAVKWIAVFLWVQTSFLYTQRHVTLTGSKDLAPGQPGVLSKLAFLPERSPEHPSSVPTQCWASWLAVWLPEAGAAYTADGRRGCPLLIANVRGASTRGSRRLAETPHASIHAPGMPAEVIEGQPRWACHRALDVRMESSPRALRRLPWPRSKGGMNIMTSVPKKPHLLLACPGSSSPRTSSPPPPPPP